MKNIKQRRHAELDSASHLISDLKSGEIPYQVRDDKFIFNDNNGFTLIELLVVVLIIGILAAVALPQYKMAVTKSRLAAVKPILNAIKTSEEIYFMANGNYTSDITLLDLEHTCTTVGSDETDNSVFTCGDNYFLIDLMGGPKPDPYYIDAYYCPGYTTVLGTCTTTKAEFLYTLYFAHSEKSNQIECSGRTSFGQEVCKKVL